MTAGLVHSLGTTASLALTALAAAAAVLAGIEWWQRWSGPRRLRRALGERPAPGRPGRGSRRQPERPPGTRSDPAWPADAGDPVDPGDLPLCADLMAACLAAGATPGEAAGVVGRCTGGPLGAALIRAQAELRLGADPADCWERFGRLSAAREMGRCLARASAAGTAPVAEMSRLAADCRAAHGRSALARARKAAVLATAPLGVCFLPAFLLVGVAPVVMGLAGSVLGGRPH